MTDLKAVLVETPVSFIETVYHFKFNCNDVVFMILLYLLTCFGLAIKRNESVEQKRWIGTCMGLATVILIMGLKDSWHFICSVFVCGVIIKKVGKRSVTFIYIYVFVKIVYIKVVIQ